MCFPGLLHIGDIIKEVNGEKVKGDPDEILSKLVSRKCCYKVFRMQLKDLL